MDWLDYREALGIGFSDLEKSKYFFNKIFNFLQTVYYSENQITTDEYFEFCNTTGNVFCGKDMCGYRLIMFSLFQSQESINPLNHFLSYYVAFINCQKDNPNKKYKREDYVKLLRKMLDESRIPYDLKTIEDKCFLFPKGAKELDDALISQPLEWLNEYPKARKIFCTALKQYSDGEYIRDAADNFRKALEEFLQEFLENEKNLETNKTEICKYLGQQGIDAGVSGLFHPLINAYKNINDRIAKHNDLVDKRLLEFLLYQTGILIRMVISIKKQKETANAD